MITADQLGIVIVGCLSLVGALYSARSARRTNTVTVDVRIFEALQEDVVRLQDRVERLREAVRAAEDETDRERKLRRDMSAQLDALADTIERMARSMHVAGVDVPEAATAYLKFPRPGYHAGAGNDTP